MAAKVGASSSETAANHLWCTPGGPDRPETYCTSVVGTLLSCWSGRLYINAQRPVSILTEAMIQHAGFGRDLLGCRVGLARRFRGEHPTLLAKDDLGRRRPYEGRSSQGVREKH
jgi:hypothetical protein